MVLVFCDLTATEGESFTNTLDFSGSRANIEKLSDSITSEYPENDFTAKVTVTSEEAIETSDVSAWIHAACRDGGAQNFTITLSEVSLTSLKGSRTVNAAFCNSSTTGQRGRVTFTVVVKGLSLTPFSAVVEASSEG